MQWANCRRSNSASPVSENGLSFFLGEATTESFSWHFGPDFILEKIQYLGHSLFSGRGAPNDSLPSLLQGVENR